MEMLDFLLDLRSLSPPLLRDVKQVGNYYAISSSMSSNGGNLTQSKPLLDRIGLCYVFQDRISGSDEMKIAYNPNGNFNLRDYHNALNNLPVDAFSPECKDFRALYQRLADLLSDKIVYARGARDNAIARKVIVIFSSLADALDYGTLKALIDVANKSILVEFILLELSSNHLGDITVNTSIYIEQIRALKNCSFRTYVPDRQVLLAIAKRWFHELKDDRRKPVKARFIFKINLNDTVNQMSCNLCPSYNPIVDGFTFCETCSCHGIPLEENSTNKAKMSPLCSVTKDILGDLDIVDNSIKVGKQTILYLPSFHGSQKLLPVSSTIDFNVIQRTNLGSLSEGLVVGASYFVTPTLLDSDESDQSERDAQLFQVVCSVLNSLDQGLVCSSNCNIETLMETSIPCYYILLPSDAGLMLLRRLSAAEEFLPIPDVRQFNSPVAKEVENTVQCLQKIELRDYDPLRHERGFHQKLNLLVKESLQFGATIPKGKEAIADSEFPEPNPALEVRPSEKVVDIVVAGEERPEVEVKVGEDYSEPCNTEEWEQLIVREFGGTHSPTFSSKTKRDKLVILPSQSNKQLDEKTSRILERLGVPRQLKRKPASPAVSSSVSDACAPVKKPLIPYDPTHAAEQGPISSQPMKPNFHRIKKKK